MKRDYPGLDLIRLGAALLVAFYHLCFWWWLPAHDVGAALDPAAGITGKFVGSGWIGVQIFFVLSGFVIAFTADGRSPGQFLQNRALRLYPTAWICATLTLLIAGGTATAYGRALLLAPTGPWISGAYWTLPIEISFYLLVSCALALRIDLTRLLAVIALLGSGYWLARTLDFLLGKPWRPFFEAVEGSSWGNLTLLTYGCYFAIGMILWAFAADRSVRSHLPLLALSLLAALLQIVSNSRSVDLKNGTQVGVVMPLLIFGAAFIGIVLAIVGNGRIEALLGERRHLVRTAGLMTYPLYLVHSEVGRDVALALAPAVGSPLAPLLALVAVTILARLVLFIEPWAKAPLRRLLERLTGKSAPHAASPTSRATASGQAAD
ncbi:acyltransferase [Sphingomonas sp. KRR8]|uniref:acyltransferase family protein n=1 Tax=Sphingomonas sp. KRR8 TaxID=2942996 RepID=UPI0020215281|nr:acyltransferase [Sphingomonas sp. KRR8]URD60429.1 acyltransferase [Sphingomonas sp. KRR8]